MGDDYIILKVRVKNSNIQKGKSAGYRMIYQVESPISVLLLTIYSKSIAPISAPKKSAASSRLLDESE
jgi:mRNA-degrading endonuclease RelE of RelBE toxin-antitoxin system